MLSNVGTHPSMLMSLVGDPHYYEPYSDRAYIVSDSFDSYTLMQYTGLKDKNGIEIYDGDILKWHSGGKGGENAKGAVYYEYGQWHLKGYSVPGFLQDNGITHWTQTNTNFEVIGNIYQTPELI